jgi:hypothetical protein
MRHKNQTSVQYFVNGPDRQGRFSVTSGGELTPDDCYMLARDYGQRAPLGSKLFRSDSGGCVEITDTRECRVMTAAGKRMLAGQQPGAEIAPGVYNTCNSDADCPCAWHRKKRDSVA